MSFTKLILMGVAGSIYEGLTGRSHVQRLVRRKAANVVRRLKGEKPLRGWQDGRTNTPKRAPTPTPEECRRLNREAARSI
jgi:hypothetical protein